MNFERDLPRLYQLYLRSAQSHPDNYFSYVDSPVASLLADESYIKLDLRLAKLDSAAFEHLISRAAPLVTLRDRDHRRHWTALFNVLNEAKGYEFLLARGYSEIRFLPPSQKTKSPDLVAQAPGTGALLEVKTLSRSDTDIESMGKVFSAAIHLSEGFKRKVRECYTEATEQCRAIDPFRARKWYAYICIELDADVAVSRSNIRRLEEFIRSVENGECEIAYESGVWS
jgi:hypothetical protein